MLRPATRSSVHWLVWQPTPYNDHLFEHLAQDPRLDITVHYRKRVVASHPWTSELAQGYRARFYATRAGIDWHVLGRALKERDAFFVVAGWDHPTSLALLVLLRLLKRPYALWTDTPDTTRVRKRAYAAMRSAILRWIFAGATRIMSTGKPGVDALRRLGAAESQLINFPFFLDLAAYAPRHALAVSVGGPLKLLSCGRISNVLKGHDLVVRAIALARTRVSAPRIEYVIAGTGPDEANLRELIRKLELEDVVTLAGWVEPAQMRALYSESHVLIHASPTHDPFPNAILEAMAAGLVVLASDACGSALDRIDHGVNGYLHKAGNVDELAGHIAHVAQHAHDLAEMGRRARTTAEAWPVERGVATVRELVARGAPLDAPAR